MSGHTWRAALTLGGVVVALSLASSCKYGCAGKGPSKSGSGVVVVVLSTTGVAIDGARVDEAPPADAVKKLPGVEKRVTKELLAAAAIGAPGEKPKAKPLEKVVVEASNDVSCTQGLSALGASLGLGARVELVVGDQKTKLDPRAKAVRAPAQFVTIRADGGLDRAMKTCSEKPDRIAFDALTEETKKLCPTPGCVLLVSLACDASTPVAALSTAVAKLEASGAKLQYAVAKPCL